jgi:hypothetical protein
MDGNVQDIWIIPESSLRSISMMYIPTISKRPLGGRSPIKDQDLLREALSLNLLCSNSDIVEETETHVFLWFGMMTRRSDYCECVPHFSLAHRQAGLNDTTTR